MPKPKIEIDIKEVERLAGLGFTQAEICFALGISEDTLGRRKKDNADIADAIKRGKHKADAAVANTIWSEAISGNMTAAIWWEKTRRGYSDKVANEQSGKVIIEVVRGDAD